MLISSKYLFIMVTIFFYWFWGGSGKKTNLFFQFKTLLRFVGQSSQTSGGYVFLLFTTPPRTNKNFIKNKKI